MKKFLHFQRLRSGTTLVELLLFLAILAIVGFSILPLVYTSVEARLFQQTVSSVEQNGIQLLQDIGSLTRNAERIVDPPVGESGSVIWLQSGSGAVNPTIIGTETGSFIIMQGNVRRVLSSSDVSILDFHIRNTSGTSSGQSLLVTFSVSRTVRLQAPRVYTQDFRGLFTLYPRGILQGGACMQPNMVPCGPPGTYSWQFASSSSCLNASMYLDCP
jgi:hypothetical protein